MLNKVIVKDLLPVFHLWPHSPEPVSTRGFDEAASGSSAEDPLASPWPHLGAHVGTLPPSPACSPDRAAVFLKGNSPAFRVRF